jgi:hypothetical protein
MIYGRQAVVAMLLPVLVGAMGCSSKTGDSIDSAPHAADAYDATPLGRMLRPRTAKAELLVLVVPPDIEATAVKLKAIAMRDPEAFAALAGNRDADDKILYDEQENFSLWRAAVAESTEKGELWLILAVKNNLTGKYLLEYWVRVPAAEK